MEAESDPLVGPISEYGSTGAGTGEADKS